MKEMLNKAVNGYIDSYRGFPFHVWVGLLAAFANALCGGMTFLFSFYLVKHLGMGIEVAGSIVSCFGIGTVIGAYMGGRLCDFFSSFKICIFALCMNAAALLAFPYIKNYYEFFIVAFMIGLSNYSFIPAARVWLMSGCSPSVRLRSMNILRMITNLGMGLSVWVSSSLAYYNFKYSFIFCSSILGFFAFILLCYGDKQVKDVVETDQSMQSSTEIKAYPSMRNIYMIYCCVLMIGLIFSQLKVSYPLYLQSSYHLNEKDFGHIFLINTFVIVLFQSYILDMFSKINHAILAGFGGLLIGLSMFLLSFGHTMIYAIFLCLIWSLGEILFFSPTQVLAFNKAKKLKKGKHMGAYQMIYASANIVGPIGGGFLYHHFSGNAVWSICGIFAILSIALCMRVYFFDVIFLRKFSHSL